MKFIVFEIFNISTNYLVSVKAAKVLQRSLQSKWLYFGLVKWNSFMRHSTSVSNCQLPIQLILDNQHASYCKLWWSTFGANSLPPNLVHHKHLLINVSNLPTNLKTMTVPKLDNFHGFKMKEQKQIWLDQQCLGITSTWCILHLNELTFACESSPLFLFESFKFQQKFPSKAMTSLIEVSKNKIETE